MSSYTDVLMDALFPPSLITWLLKGGKENSEPFCVVMVSTTASLCYHISLSYLIVLCHQMMQVVHRSQMSSAVKLKQDDDN